MDLVLLAIAGALGALSRYGVYRWVGELAAGNFPWATILVNCSGSLLFGFFVVLADEGSGLISVRARVVILAGFMGAFTTFSTFAFETLELLRNGYVLRALANAAVQNLGALACLALGALLARALVA